MFSEPILMNKAIHPNNWRGKEQLGCETSYEMAQL
jgi:hypothetical protein